MTVPGPRPPGDINPASASAVGEDYMVQHQARPETSPVISPDEIAAAAGGIVDRLIEPHEQFGPGSEFARVESQWANLIAAASLSVEAGTESQPPIQRDSSSGPRSRDRKARGLTPQDRRKRDEFLDAELQRFLDGYEPVVDDDGRHYMGDTNIKLLTGEIGQRVRGAIEGALDRTLELLKARPSAKDTEAINKRKEIREKCAAVRASVEACMPPEEHATTERRKREENVKSDLTQYHRLQREIGNARRRGEDTLPLVMYQRSFVGAVTRKLLGLQPDAQANFETFMGKTVRKLDKRDGAHEGISGSYETMMKGVKLEIAVFDALHETFADEEFTETVGSGWHIEAAPIQEDVMRGTDLFITVPLSSGAVKIRVDVKAMGSFNTGVVDGYFSRVQSHERALAVNNKHEEPVLVINAEHKSVGGGLAAVEPGDRKSPDSFMLNDPIAFTKWFARAARQFASEQQRAQG